MTDPDQRDRDQRARAADDVRRPGWGRRRVSIAESLHRRAKLLAVSEGRLLQALIDDLVRESLDRREAPPPPSGAPPRADDPRLPSPSSQEPPCTPRSTQPE